MNSATVTGLLHRTNRGGFKVYIDGKLLSPRPSQRLYNHSPDGFAWGYGGSGPAQLSLAILLYFSDKEFALQHYQKFKWDVVANQPQHKELEIDNNVIVEWIKQHGG